jgi:hypothetical protein
MNREELISAIKANITKSISLLNAAESRVDEVNKKEDLDVFFLATDQMSIALEQIHVGIDEAVRKQNGAEIINIFDGHRSKVISRA